MMTDTAAQHRLDTASADRVDAAGARAGDEDAFRRLIERHQGRIAAMMWRFIRDRETHEELVEDVFIEAHRSLHTFRADAPFEHWLARIATRVGYRHWKRSAKKSARQTVPIEEWDGAADLRSQPDQLAPERAAELLHALLERLPPRDRLILTLRYVQGHSVAETAALTGWSQPMVKVQTLRARGKLRKIFAALRVEDGT
ncbi:MAG: RNA polymerase sigma factor [Kiritimatiellae bacterium]|nr:RNA polymerase sigma factor [Kiritimatiellia bacterium]